LNRVAAASPSGNPRLSTDWITATSVGRRFEIGIDENDILSVRVDGDDSGEVGMDDVLRALEDKE
jgi:hypothetical protein